MILSYLVTQLGYLVMKQEVNPLTWDQLLPTEAHGYDAQVVHGPLPASPSSTGPDLST